MPPYSVTCFSHNAPSDIGLHSIYLLNGSLHHDNIEGSTSADFVDFGAHHYIICSSTNEACSYAGINDLVDYFEDNTPNFPHESSKIQVSTDLLRTNFYHD